MSTFAMARSTVSRSANVTNNRLDGAALWVIKWSNIQRSHPPPSRQEVTTQIDTEKSRTPCDQKNSAAISAALRPSHGPTGGRGQDSEVAYLFFSYRKYSIETFYFPTSYPRIFAVPQVLLPERLDPQQ